MSNGDRPTAGPAPLVTSVGRVHHPVSFGGSKAGSVEPWRTGSERPWRPAHPLLALGHGTSSEWTCHFQRSSMPSSPLRRTAARSSIRLRGDRFSGMGQNCRAEQLCNPFSRPLTALFHAPVPVAGDGRRPSAPWPRSCTRHRAAAGRGNRLTTKSAIAAGLERGSQGMPSSSGSSLAMASHSGCPW